MTGWVRTTVRVPLPYVRSMRQRYGDRGQKQLLADVRARAERMGLPDVRAVMQDPTNNSLIRIISQQPQPTRPLQPDDIVTIIAAEAVEVPPAFAAPEPGVMDPGLTGDELVAIRTALLHEGNPRHISGFASTLEPYFPVSASLLRAKGILLECRARRNALRLGEANERAARRVSELVDRKAGVDRGMGQQVLKWMEKSQPNVSVGQNLQALTQKESQGKWLDVASRWASLVNVLPEKFYALDRMKQVMQGLSSQPASLATQREHSIDDLRGQLEAQAKASGIPVELIRDEVRRAACLIIQHPEYVLEDRSKSAAALDLEHQQLSKFSPLILDIARRIVREIGLGVWIVDPDLLRSVCPPDETQGFVSPSALQLALALSKPKHAKVMDVSKVFVRNAVLQGNRPRDATTTRVDLLKAQAQMERANRAIERRRWVEWYRRASQSGLL